MTYTVNPGDTLFTISIRFKTPMLSIIYANNITTPDLINVGDVLTIPDEEDNPFSIEVVLDDTTLKLLNNKKVLKHYSVAVGTKKNPTPRGQWYIKGKYLWGDPFGGHFMQLNVPWGIYGIHGTNKPWSIGTRASHGCIRMYSQQAAQLYNIVPKGTPVLIY